MTILIYSTLIGTALVVFSPSIIEKLSPTTRIVSYAESKSTPGELVFFHLYHSFLLLNDKNDWKNVDTNRLIIHLNCASKQIHQMTRPLRMDRKAKDQGTSEFSNLGSLVNDIENQKEKLNSELASLELFLGTTLPSFIRMQTNHVHPQVESISELRAVLDSLYIKWYRVWEFSEPPDFTGITCRIICDPVPAGPGLLTTLFNSILGPAVRFFKNIWEFPLAGVKPTQILVGIVIIFLSSPVIRFCLTLVLTTVQNNLIGIVDPFYSRYLTACITLITDQNILGGLLALFAVYQVKNKT